MKKENSFERYPNLLLIALDDLDLIEYGYKSSTNFVLKVSVRNIAYKVLNMN